MKIKQLSTQEALDAYLNGRPVRCILPVTTDWDLSDWKDSQLVLLDEILSSMIMLGEPMPEPVKIEKEVTGMKKAEEVFADIGTEIDDEPDPDAPQEKRGPKPGYHHEVKSSKEFVKDEEPKFTKRLELNSTELLKLEESGMTKAAMAEHFGVSAPTLAKHLKKAHEALDLAKAVID